MRPSLKKGKFSGAIKVLHKANPFPVLQYSATINPTHAAELFDLNFNPGLTLSYMVSFSTFVAK